MKKLFPLAALALASIAATPALAAHKPGHHAKAASGHHAKKGAMKGDAMKGDAMHSDAMKGDAMKAGAMKSDGPK